MNLEYFGISSNTNTDTMESTEATTCFKKAFYTDKGLELAILENDVPKNAMITQSTGLPLINYAVHIQTVDGARIFAIVNHTDGWYNPNERYSMTTILANLVAGKFDIGFIAKNQVDEPNVIKHIFPLVGCDEYMELRLHYTDKGRTDPRNISWRNIVWDLFGNNM